MPVGYIYGNEVYVVDVVFDNAGTQFTKPECANMLIKHNVKTVTFESNSAGEYFGRETCLSGIVIHNIHKMRVFVAFYKMS